MKHLPLLLIIALAGLAACGKKDPVPPAPTSAPGGSSPSGTRPDKMANGEPAVVTVKHVLIAFAGAAQSTQTRTREEAEKLAFEVVNRAKAGEDFDRLIKELSNDPGDGTYTMVNHGLEPRDDEWGRSGAKQLVQAFGDVGFRIAVGEVGLADYDPQKSPFGYHVIKRVK